MREERQEDLLAHYQELLSHNPLASPPDGLDPDIATTAALLHRRLQPPEPSVAFVERLGRQLAARAPAGEPMPGIVSRDLESASAEGNEVLGWPQWPGSMPRQHQSRPRRLRGWVSQTMGMAAAVVVLLVVGGLLMAVLDSRGVGSDQQAGAGPSSTPSSTDQRTMVGTTSSPTMTTPAETPAAPTSAWAGIPQGAKLAVVSSDGLSIRDLDAGTSTDVPLSGNVTRIIWSPSGQWVAVTGQQQGPEQLWLVEASTGQAQEVSALPELSGGVAWSPATDLLAVATADGIWAVAPGESPQRMTPESMRTGNFAWSADGKQLAFVRYVGEATSPSGRGSQLYTMAIDTETPPQQHFTAAGAEIVLADWWPDGNGLLFWRLPAFSASMTADGVPLETLALGSQAPQELDITLRRDDWLSWTPEGNRLLISAGAGRWPGQPKAVAGCDVETATCQSLPQPEGLISLDPAWSPDGSQIAFVRAPEGYPSGDEALEQWRAARTLWLAKPDGTEARQIEVAGSGVSDPLWLPDGKHLVYQQDHAVWLLDLESGTTEQILTLDEDLSAPESFWGDWGDTIAWHW